MRVCFVEPGEIEPPSEIDDDVAVSGFTEFRKEWIRKTLEEQFTPSRTGIHFVGFGDCHEEPGDVFVWRSRPRFNGAGTTGTASAYRIGQAEQVAVCPPGVESEGCEVVEGADPGAGLWGFSRLLRAEATAHMRLNSDAFCSHKAAADLCRKGQLIHEFGHIAGLRHEHARPEAAEDQRCIHYNLAAKTSEGTGATAEYVGPYDPKSIMNYCYRWDLNAGYEPALRSPDPAGLSPGDLASLRALYL